VSDGDIDKKDFEGSEKEFEELDLKVRQAVENVSWGNEDYCLMTASSYLQRRRSWRFVMTNYKGTLEQIKKWVQLSIPNIALPEGVTLTRHPTARTRKSAWLGATRMVRTDP